MANTVVHNVGLFVSVFDLLDIGDSFLLHDGCSHTAVTFRALVFRPFVEEVLVGRIKSCSQQVCRGRLCLLDLVILKIRVFIPSTIQTGVAVTLGFFDDIVIPPEALQHPYRFDENEQVWVWEYPTEDGDHHDLYMDIGEEIRFRVTSETFVDASPCTEPKSEPPTQRFCTIPPQLCNFICTCTIEGIFQDPNAPECFGRRARRRRQGAGSGGGDDDGGRPRGAPGGEEDTVPDPGERQRTGARAPIVVEVVI